MFIAHLPAGYLLSRTAGDRTAALAIIVGSVLPDLDMLWFYFVDHGRVHHHRYLTHVPAVWAGIGVIAWLLSRARLPTRPLSLLSIGALAHIILDTVVGDVMWLWPISDRFFALDVVPARFDPWWLNFLLHRSFALELLLVAWAVVLFRRRRPIPADQVEAARRGAARARPSNPPRS